MNRLSLGLLLAAILLPSQSHAIWPFGVDDDDVREAEERSIENEQESLNQRSSVCQFISKDACDLISKKSSVLVRSGELTPDDMTLLKEVMEISSERIAAKSAKLDPARTTILTNSAMQLGFSLGKATEATRYNRIFRVYARLFDKSIRFSDLLIQTKSGRNIVPPIVVRSNGVAQVEQRGRVFRVSDIVYEIAKPAKFTIEAPNWREYLIVPVNKVDAPIESTLPETKEELAFWRSKLLSGFRAGKKSAYAIVDENYRRLESDYEGMVRYHLLRTFNMISKPKIVTKSSPTISNREGSMLAIDDTVQILVVEPRLISARESWKVYPRLKRFEASMSSSKRSNYSRLLNER